MRLWLKECQVGCAGPFRDRRLPCFTPGFNVLFGLNEAGKTTLLRFLRGMLFGFEKTALTSPDGAEPGGALTLADDNGREWHLSRWGKGKKARLELSSMGVSLPGAAGLTALLHQVSKPVFESVFAFGLEELANLKTLDQQGVRELLYSASLGLGRVSVTGAAGDLKKQAESLFNPDPRAFKPEINQLLGELGRVRQTLRELEKQPQEFQALLAELSRVATELGDLNARLQEAQEKRAWLSKLSQAWPVWQPRGEALADLEVVPVLDFFPPDGLLRLERLSGDLAAHQTAAAELREELGAARRALAACEPDMALLAESGALEDLFREKILFEDRRERLARVALEADKDAARLEEALGRLGPDWDEARLLAFPLSLGWRQDIRERSQRLDAAREAQRRAHDARFSSHRLVQFAQPHNLIHVR
uniref:YhaN AAA domain-containing protein n=1 Tax=Desulfobacca acetoxidans TaxID=60893 RepID=A0A7V4G9H3_9BACT